MLGQWSVTGFTTDIRVLAFALGLDLIRMASFACLTASELDGPFTDVVQRRWPKKTGLAKVGRDYGASDNQECDCAERQQQYYPIKCSVLRRKSFMYAHQQLSDPW